MRVLICGGRDFNNPSFIRSALENLLFAGTTIPSNLFIIEGAGPGVRGEPSCDELVYQWRMRNKLEGARYPVDHTIDGPWPGAGPKRNLRMLEESKPDRGIAFPGGRGTANMVKLMRDIHLHVLELKPPLVKYGVA